MNDINKTRILDLSRLNSSGFDFKNSNIILVGLGLIGASLAKSLKNAGCEHIIGIDKKVGVLESLKGDSILSEIYTDAGITENPSILSTGDLTVLCLYPSASADFIKMYAEYFKENSIVTDVCGVKSEIEKAVHKISNKNFHYISGHPMAGKEEGGFENSDENLFAGANFIITTFECPSDDSSLENVSDGFSLEYAMNVIEEMAFLSGCRRISYLSAEEHDRTIAFTSQLAHALALSVCICQKENDYKIDGFTGGSYQDITRVANINVDLWEKLFMSNSEDLYEVISDVQKSLEDFKAALASGSLPTLRNLMLKGRKEGSY